MIPQPFPANPRPIAAHPKRYTQALEALFTVFNVDVAEDGGVVFTHVSGSTVEFTAAGNVEVEAAADLVLDYERFMRVQTTEAQVECWFQRRLIQILRSALEAKRGNSAHCTHR